MAVDSLAAAKSQHGLVSLPRQDLNCSAADMDLNCACEPPFANYWPRGQSAPCSVEAIIPTLSEGLISAECSVAFLILHCYLFFFQCLLSHGTAPSPLPLWSVLCAQNARVYICLYSRILTILRCAKIWVAQSQPSVLITRPLYLAGHPVH